MLPQLFVLAIGIVVLRMGPRVCRKYVADSALGEAAPSSEISRIRAWSVYAACVIFLATKLAIAVIMGPPAMPASPAVMEAWHAQVPGNFNVLLAVAAGAYAVLFMGSWLLLRRARRR